MTNYLRLALGAPNFISVMAFGTRIVLTEQGGFRHVAEIAGVYPKLGNLDCWRPSDFAIFISLIRKSSVVETG
jgi:hypothetical protein